MLTTTNVNAKTTMKTPQLPTTKQKSTPIRVIHSENGSPVMAARAANGQYRTFRNLDTNTVDFAHGGAYGAAELSKSKRAMVEVVGATLQAPRKLFAKLAPPALVAAVSGLAGFGVWKLTGIVVAAVAPHAAHAVILGVSIAAVALLGALVVGYYAVKGVQQLKEWQKAAVIKDLEYKNLVAQDVYNSRNQPSGVQSNMQQRTLSAQTNLYPSVEKRRQSSGQFDGGFNPEMVQSPSTSYAAEGQIPSWPQ